MSLLNLSRDIIVSDYRVRSECYSYQIKWTSGGMLERKMLQQSLSVKLRCYSDFHRVL